MPRMTPDNQAELFSTRFAQIGSIFRSTAGDYEVGAIPAFGGPFSTAEEYYVAWVDAEVPHIESKPVVNQGFPRRLAKIAPSLSKSNHGPFALCHPDLGSHNILVDDQYNILSIIDWGVAPV